MSALKSGKELPSLCKFLRDEGAWFKDRRSVVSKGLAAPPGHKKCLDRGIFYVLAERAQDENPRSTQFGKAAEELAIFTAVDGAAFLTDAVDGDVASYTGASLSVDGGDGNVANLQLDINANAVWAILFSVKMQ